MLLLKQQTHAPSDGPNELNWIILHNLMTDCTKLQAWPKTINKQREKIVYLITYLMPRLTMNPNKHGQEDWWNCVGWISMPGRRFPNVRAVPTGAITAFRRPNWINTPTPIPPLSFQCHLKHSSWTSFPSAMNHWGGELTKNASSDVNLSNLCSSAGKKKHPIRLGQHDSHGLKVMGVTRLNILNSVNTVK